MKIFLPFTIRDIGGTATFAEKFKCGMEDRGHEVFFEYRRDYDVLFLIVQAPFKFLIEAKRRRKPIIQRLDGTYYWSVAGWKYPLYNLKASIIRHLFSNFTIYQSTYSKYCAQKFLGKKRLEQSSIIYNGVDIDIFSPSGAKKSFRDNPEQKIFFTASAFRREDQIIPIFNALKIYKKKYGNNFKFLIAGTFSGKARRIPETYASYGNAIFLGKIGNSQLPEYERAADVFLFTHLNPPCPNNILEAMACGLPICGVADGAMVELVRERKNALLIPTSGDAFWKNRSHNIEAFADNLNDIVKNLASFSRESSRIATERFPLESMIDKYEFIFTNLLR